jgi:hypothetical protein
MPMSAQEYQRSPLAPTPAERCCQACRGSDRVSTSTRSAPAPVLTVRLAPLSVRDVLGDKSYQSLARKGEAMTTAAIATYAYDQIDQARAELNAVSN